MPSSLFSPFKARYSDPWQKQMSSLAPELYDERLWGIPDASKLYSQENPLISAPSALLRSQVSQKFNQAVPDTLSMMNASGFGRGSNLAGALMGRLSSRASQSYSQGLQGIYSQAFQDYQNRMNRAALARQIVLRLRTEKDARKRAFLSGLLQTIGSIGGTVVGAALGGPPGAAAGYAAGSSLGSSAGSRGYSTDPYGYPYIAGMEPMST